MTDRTNPDVNRLPEAATSTGLDVHRRDVLALGAAVAAVGTGLGAGTTLAAQEELDEENGLFLTAATGDQQPDSIDTPATAAAVFCVSEHSSEIEYALVVNAIEDANQAHIHLGGQGEEGPVAVWLYPGPDATEPELQEGRFDGVLATGTITDGHLTEEVEGQTVDALLDEIADGDTYVNVHTEEHPGGEIRGQLVSIEDVVAALTDDDPPDDEPDDDAPEEEYDFDDQPEDAAVTFETPMDGDTVQSPVEISAAVDGIDLEPAGTMEVGTGHLHVLVDHECFESAEVIPGPSDSAEEDGIFHWSDGQSEDELELEPGEYDLCIQIGDGGHRAFGETDEITITVEES